MTTITFRTDTAVEEALVELVSNERDRSQVIRDAILAAARRARDEAIYAEALAVAADADDRAEARVILEEMDALRAW